MLHSSSHALDNFETLWTLTVFKITTPSCKTSSQCSSHIHSLRTYLYHNDASLPENTRRSLAASDIPTEFDLRCVSYAKLASAPTNRELFPNWSHEHVRNVTRSNRLVTVHKRSIKSRKKEVQNWSNLNYNVPSLCAYKRMIFSIELIAILVAVSILPNTVLYNLLLVDFLEVKVWYRIKINL